MGNNGTGRHHLRWYAVAAVAIIVLVVTASLAALGDLPGFGTPSNSPSPFTTERTSAEAAARSYGPADLSVRWAVGFAASDSMALPDNFTYFPVRSPACAITSVALADRNVTRASNVSTGEATDWTFVFANTSNHYLVVVVVGGVARVTEGFSGSGCPFASPQFAAVPDTIGGPEVAAGTAAHAGGYAFMARHAAANVTFILNSPGLGSPVTGPRWSIVYSDCPPAASSVRSGAFFEALVNGSTGALDSAQNYTGTCPYLDQVVTTPLSSALAVTSAFESSSGGTNWYNFTVRALSAPITIGSLSAAVQDSTGTNLSLPNAGLTVVTSGGSSLAQYDLLNGSWASGAATALGVGDRFVLTTTASLSGQGDWLQFVGHGYYDGSVNLSIS